MSEKDFEVGSDIPVVNAWDEPAGEASGKVLVKTMTDQPGTSEPLVETVQPIVEATIEPVEVVVPDVPFVAPNLDFTMSMPKVETPISKPIITVNEVNPVAGYSVEIPVNSVELPKFDMPEVVVKNINSITPPLEVSDVVIPNEINNVEIKDIPIVNEVVIPEVNNIDIKDIPTVLPIENVVDEVVTPEIKTMSAEELNQTFANVINNDDPLKDVIRKPGETMQIDSLPITGEMVEAYQEKNDNTFSNIFSNVPTTDDTFMSSAEKVGLETKPGVPAKEERVELTPLPSNLSYRKKKKRLIPAGWGLGVFLFGLVLIYIIYLDEISQFLNNILGM